MKILVPIKRVIDYKVRIRIKPDQSGVVTDNVKMSINPFDEIAIEEAIRLKETGLASEVSLISIGTSLSQEVLRYGLALGADRAILVETEQSVQPLSIAKILKKIVEKELPDLIILGKQAIDNDNNQIGQMLAALLNYPQATFASKIDINGKTVEVTREIDGGLQTIASCLPMVITTDLRLNEPRYVSLPNIMKAKNKPIETIQLDNLNIDLMQHYDVLKVTAPPVRATGILVNDTKALLDKLRNEVKVIK